MNIILNDNPGSVDWTELTGVFERAPLGVRDPEKLRRAFEKSHVRCFAYCEGRLVGAARAISDGEYYAGIYDVIIAPEYQRQGIGRRISS